MSRTRVELGDFNAPPPTVIDADRNQPTARQLPAESRTDPLERSAFSHPRVGHPSKRNTPNTGNFFTDCHARIVLYLRDLSVDMTIG